MNQYSRFAIYYLPQDVALADFGARWLGWDAQAGAAVAHLTKVNLPVDLPAITHTPRRYGFHGTIKPPFRRAEGLSMDDLDSAARKLAARCRVITLQGLELSRIGNFMALTPTGNTAKLTALAARFVTELDGFRAASTAGELARRRQQPLTARQEELLTKWGYPYVLDQFRFHLTLTGPIDDATAKTVEAWLQPRLAGILPRPFRISSLCLCGEGADGNFRLLQRYPLGS